MLGISRRNSILPLSPSKSPEEQSLEPAEAIFRQVERTLDDLVAAAREPLRSHGVQISELGGNDYACKGDYLGWSCRFETDWIVKIETARVTIHLSYGEPIPEEFDLPPQIELFWIAELFQLGCLSRLERRAKLLLPLRQLQQLGIAWLVTAAIQAGQLHLPPPCPI